MRVRVRDRVTACALASCARSAAASSRAWYGEVETDRQSKGLG